MPRRKAAPKPPSSPDAPMVVDGAADSSADASNKPRAKRGPAPAAENAKALADILSVLLGFSTDLLEMATHAPGVAMLDAEADAIAAPAARMLARTTEGKRFARFLGTHRDGVDLLMALGAYAERVAPVAMDSWAMHAQARAVAKEEKRTRGQTIPAAAQSHARRGGDRQPATRTDAAAPVAAAELPAASGNGHANGYANGYAPNAADLADPIASNIVSLYPGGIRPING